MSTRNSRTSGNRSFHPLPCSKVDDLYSPDARATIRRLIGDWLNRQRLTVTEFIHSAAALEKFEGAGTTYQHAVQKMAVTVAGKSKTPVVQIVKTLNELSGAAIRRVYTDERRGLFPTVDAGQFAEMADTFADEPGASYVLTGTLTKYLAATKTWNDKLLQVLALREAAPKEEQARALLLSITDSFAAELVSDAAILTELLGSDQEFGQTLLTAVWIFQGVTGEAVEKAAESLKLLAGHFAKDELPNARAAIARYILSQCKGARRLCASSLDAELKAFRRLVDELKAVQSRYLSCEGLDAAFAERSKRFITQEALFQFTSALKTPDEKLECLLAVEENIEGAANKRALTPFAASLLGSHNFEEEVAAGAPCAQRLKRVADLQGRVQRSGFQDVQRDKMVGMLDAIAVRIEAQGRLFAGLEARIPDPAERVDTFLKLFSARLFTEGSLARKARRALLASLAKPDFLSRYTMDKGQDRQAVLIDLVERLKRIGISPEESVRAMTP